MESKMAKQGYGREKAPVNVGSAQESGNSLSGAVKELKSQHPIPYSDTGPHHDMNHHIRHKPAVKPA